MAVNPSILRKKLKITQAEMGGVVGVHPLTVSRWDRGCNLPVPALQEIVDIMGRVLRSDEARAEFRKRLREDGHVAARAYLYDLKMELDRKK